VFLSKEVLDLLPGSFRSSAQNFPNFCPEVSELLPGRFGDDVALCGGISKWELLSDGLSVLCFLVMFHVIRFFSVFPQFQEAPMHDNRSWWQLLSEATRLRLLIIPILLICTVLPTVWGLANNPDWSGLALNFGTDMGGTLVTFILIDLLLGSREKREEEEREKARLIGQMHSRDNGLTLAAVEQLRAHGWLMDGTLRGANLVNANLQSGYVRYADLRDVNLHRANFRKTRLGHTDLRGADLEDADFQEADMDEVKLQGAQVLLTQLAQANRLRGAMMPEGWRYDGRFRLPGDLKDAAVADIATSDPAAMASFYGVSLEEYIAGQAQEQGG
jgi:hypothetical protein